MSPWARPESVGEALARRLRARYPALTFTVVVGVRNEPPFLAVDASDGSPGTLLGTLHIGLDDRGDGDAVVCKRNGACGDCEFGNLVMDEFQNIVGTSGKGRT